MLPKYTQVLKQVGQWAFLQMTQVQSQLCGLETLTYTLSLSLLRTANSTAQIHMGEITEMTSTNHRLYCGRIKNTFPV